MNLASLSLTKSEWSQTCAQGSSGNIFVAANVFSSFHRSEIISTWPQLSLQAFPKKASDFFFHFSCQVAFEKLFHDEASLKGTRS